MTKVLKTIAVISAFGAGAAQAATVDVSYDQDVGYTMSDGIREDTATYATDLVGAVITANYTDGTSETSVWTQFTTWTAGVVADGYDLSYKWWGFELLTDNRLASLAFDLAPAGVIFDAVVSGDSDVSTTGTKGGSPLSLDEYGSPLVENTSLAGTVTAEYDGLVQLDGEEPAGDAFTNLLIDFTGTSEGGLLGGVTLVFDTDVLAGGAADLTAVMDEIAAVPLPAAGWLLLAGLGGLFATRRVKAEQPALA